MFLHFNGSFTWIFRGWYFSNNSASTDSQRHPPICPGLSTRTNTRGDDLHSFLLTFPKVVFSRTATSCKRKKKHQQKHGDIMISHEILFDLYGELDFVQHDRLWVFSSSLMEMHYLQWDVHLQMADVPLQMLQPTWDPPILPYSSNDPRRLHSYLFLYTSNLLKPCDWNSLNLNFFFSLPEAEHQLCSCSGLAKRSCPAMTSRYCLTAPRCAWKET